jgi:CysZ protein
MIANAAITTATQLFSAPFRAVLWKSLGLTIALFIGLSFALEALVSTFLLPFLGPWPWLSTAIAFVLGAGVFVAMGFLIAPVMTVFAGIFLDEVAEVVEETHYPADLPGKALPIIGSTLMSVRFLALVLGVNILALILMLFFGLGVVIFFLANGYLLGREYFQFAAMRHGTEEEADALRKRHATTIFIAGLLIAGLLAVPILNLLVPLFAAGLMVHLHKAITSQTY